jgi:hypothetical protein
MKRREVLKFLSAALWPMLWPFAGRAQYLTPSQVSPAPAPNQNPPNPAPTSAPAADNSVGTVATLSGHATVTRGRDAASALKVKDQIFEQDTLQTEANSTLGITFDDETTFSLSANTRIVVDRFVYQEGAKGNAALFNVTSGTAAFVASLVAKNGDMKISTPEATLGIRGTTGVVDVPAAGAGGAPIIKLYPDSDGHVGRIEVFDRAGARLGALTQGASAFTIRPGANGRLTAVPYQIPPQEAARDRGVLQRLNASHAIGRQMAIQRRQFRQQQRNIQPQPGRQNLRNPERNFRGPGQQNSHGPGEQPRNRFVPRFLRPRNYPGERRR